MRLVRPIRINYTRELELRVRGKTWDVEAQAVAGSTHTDYYAVHIE